MSKSLDRLYDRTMKTVVRNIEQQPRVVHFTRLVDLCAAQPTVDELETLADLFALRPDARPDDALTVYWYNAIVNHPAHKGGRKG